MKWSVLMKRTWGFEVLVCPRCAGPMNLISVIEDRDTAKKILIHMGLPARAPPSPERQLALIVPLVAPALSRCRAIG